jgi:hypothetical protein
MNKITNREVMAFLLGTLIATALQIVRADFKYEDYRLVHQTNIGGVVIDGKHIFELVELSDPAQGVVRK